MLEYRKAIGELVWHSHFRCTSWPKTNFIAAMNLLTEEICAACNDIHALNVVTCAVIVDQKPCGRELFVENSQELFYCPVGHHTRII
jgi:hypothetical protein